MGILFSAYHVLNSEIYLQVPKLRCNACGTCCVSPHMTLIEFCYLMKHLLDNPEQLARTISRIVPEHPSYPGQLACRFQTPDNLCCVYPHRALACRLHGHPVLEKAGMQYHIHCKRVKQTDCTLKMGDVHSLLDLLTSLNQGYYSHYTPPYWISGLNTESWLTILSTDMPQHIFRLLKKIMLKEPGFQDIAQYFSQRVKINEKLALIELFQSELSRGCFENLEHLLQKIQNNFPDTGAYYYFEAEMYKKALEEKTG